MINLTKENFELEVLQHEGPVFVDFFSETCPYCMAVLPFIRESAAKYGDKLKFGEVNTGEVRGLARSQKVMSIPFISIYKDGVRIEEIIGADATEQSIGALIEKYI